MYKIFASVFICFLIVPITSNKIRSTNLKYGVSGFNTFNTNAGEGNIFNLSPIFTYCRNSALSYFKLERKKRIENAINYTGTCVSHPSFLSTKTIYKFTEWNKTAEDPKKSVNYLDRHLINCGENHLLSGFQLQRDESKIRYRYECLPAKLACCKTFESPKEKMGDRSNFYLDRQYIGMNYDSTMAFQSIKLSTSYNPDRMWYTYTMCQFYEEEPEKENSKRIKELTEILAKYDKYTIPDLERRIKNLNYMKNDYLKHGKFVYWTWNTSFEDLNDYIRRNKRNLEILKNSRKNLVYHLSILNKTTKEKHPNINKCLL